MGRVEEIAAVDGIDAVFFGPADLSADMGYFGKPTNPETMKLMMDGLEVCKRIGVPVGILTNPEDVTIGCLKAGFHLLRSALTRAFWPVSRKPYWIALKMAS